MTKTPYKDFYELIEHGHKAKLSPQEIHQRFVASGLPRHSVPPVHVIRRIGWKLFGARCRWAQPKDNIKVWRSSDDRNQHLIFTKKSLL